MTIKKIKTEMVAGGSILEERDMYTDTCIYCGKVIIAYTKNQVNFRMGVHHAFCKANKNRKKKE